MIAEYREIARVYHPDISTDPKANEVMAKVNQLYEEALRLIDAGTWEVSNQIILKDKSGKKYVGRYLKQVPFELGEAYIANSSVTYLFAQKNKKFFDNAMEQIKGLRYANRKMEDEISRFMPQILYALSLEDGRYCILMSQRNILRLSIFTISLKHFCFLTLGMKRRPGSDALQKRNWTPVFWITNPAAKLIPLKRLSLRDGFQKSCMTSA